MPFPLLAAPLRIGPHTARNRVVFGAHFTRFTEPSAVAGEPGLYGARLGRYLAERAAGGAAVVIAGQAAVHPTTAYQMPNNAAAWKPEAIAGFEAVTAPVREHGALAFIQLSHNGGVNDGTWSKLPVWAPSAVANYNEPPKPLDKHEIRELVEHFAVSAANAAAGGFDGIEVHAAHGYLIHEFLSPTSNLRTDEYGGSLENRMRFAVEVLSEVREKVGDGVAVGVRLVGDEEHWDGSGLGPEAVAEIAARLEQLGLVDFLNVSVGTSGIGMVRPMYVPHAFAAATTGVVKAAVGDTPVLAVHRIVTPSEAEAILAAGQADAVTVVRALIADPAWTAKALAGDGDRIRPCTGCNQGCYGNLTASLPGTCSTNPIVGREAELGGPLPPAAEPRRVVVVGGGPAGLEAARVAAARGHDVTLLERGEELGGKVLAAATLPGRAEMAGFVDWRITECARLGVDVRLGVDADADAVLGLHPDAVVVATGGDATTDARSKWHPLPIPGAEGEWVLDHEEALARADEISGRVVLVDAVGFIDGIGVAERLREGGAEVTVVMPLAQPMLADAETMVKALGRAARKGVRWRPNTVAGFASPRAAATGGDAPHEVTVFDTYSRESETLPVDWLVVRTHGRPRDGLYHGLVERVGAGRPDVVRVGDAVAVRWVDRAVFDGHRAGRAL
jgi:2,4-dienoyl-CoA reductase-like NADH-dependent reductase (Old Yellow Enzyme family)